VGASCFERCGNSDRELEFATAAAGPDRLLMNAPLTLKFASMPVRTEKDARYANR